MRLYRDNLNHTSQFRRNETRESPIRLRYETASTCSVVQCYITLNGLTLRYMLSLTVSAFSPLHLQTHLFKAYSNRFNMLDCYFLQLFAQHIILYSGRLQTHCTLSLSLSLAFSSPVSLFYRLCLT